MFELGHFQSFREILTILFTLLPIPLVIRELKPIIAPRVIVRVILTLKNLLSRVPSVVSHSVSTGTLNVFNRCRHYFHFRTILLPLMNINNVFDLALNILV